MPPFDSNEINEYDCFTPTKERPFPNMISQGGENRICHPNSESMLTTFDKPKYTTADNICVTNGFGPAKARTLCNSPCKMEEPEQEDSVSTY